MRKRASSAVVTRALSLIILVSPTLRQGCVYRTPPPAFCSRVERAPNTDGRTGRGSQGIVVGPSLFLLYGTQFGKQITSSSSEVNQELCAWQSELIFAGPPRWSPAMP